MAKEIKFKLAELFCGPGGLALGAMRSVIKKSDTTYGIEPIWANDIDPDTCKTYAKNIHGGANKDVVCAPVQDIDFKKVPKFDALAVSFPCNDFSVVGKQKGFDGKYGPLYSHGLRAINTHNPQWFIAENVSGLQSANNGEAFKKILEDLESRCAALFWMELYPINIVLPDRRDKFYTIIGPRRYYPLILRDDMIGAGKVHHLSIT